jgi:alkylated DNA repair dioxygenase AlkB
MFGDVIGLSLLSSCRFRLRRKTGTRWERASLTVEPRSAYLMRGPSRTEWEHSIPGVESLRYSITFRNFVTGYTRG